MPNGSEVPGDVDGLLFERRTLPVLKLARADLIYLALGMEREERTRAAQGGPEGLSMPMTMDTFDDEWKA